MTTFGLLTTTTMACQQRRKEDKLAHRIELFLQDDLLCSQCVSNPTNILLMDCAHIPMCHDCLKQCLHCPVCQTTIKRAVKLTPVRTSYHDLVAKETLDLWIHSHCVVCRKKRRNILFLDCSHLLVCSDCVAGITKCPVCRCYITNTKEIFI